jgi:PAS domain S-box-containing protein
VIDLYLRKFLRTHLAIFELGKVEFLGVGRTCARLHAMSMQPQQVTAAPGKAPARGDSVKGAAAITLFRAGTNPTYELPHFVVSRSPNREYEIEAFNDSFAEALCRRETVPGMPARLAFLQSIARQLTERLGDCEMLRQPANFTLPVRRNRALKSWKISLVPLSETRGGSIQIAGYAYEVTGAADLRDGPVARDVLERLAATSHDILYVADLRRNGLIYVNERVRSVLGYDVDELTSTDGSPFLSLVHPADMTTLREHTLRLRGLADKAISSVEFRVRRADGHYVWLRVSDAIFERDVSGAALRIVGSAIDVTDNRHLLEDLKRISNRLLEAQSEERRRIARELHDSTAQQLVALSLGFARMEQILKRGRNLEQGKRELTEVLTELRSVARDAQQQIRTLSYLLHPPIVESVGLADALRRLLSGFMRRTKIRTHLAVTPAFSCGSHSVSTALMRIVQEALTNVFRHANATEVKISLANQNRRTILEIEDNGKGMPGIDADSEAEMEAFGVGIPGMRARVKQFRGVLQISSNERGTILRAIIPDRTASLLEVDD